MSSTMYVAVLWLCLTLRQLPGIKYCTVLYLEYVY